MAAQQFDDPAFLGHLVKTTYIDGGGPATGLRTDMGGIVQSAWLMIEWLIDSLASERGVDRADVIFEMREFFHLIGQPPTE